MKLTRYLLVTLTALSFSVLAQAQETVNDLESDFGGRLSVSADKKIVKGVHVSASAEARFSDNFSELGRYQFGLGFSWKLSSLFKVGAGYALIEKKNGSDVWKPRHRFYVDGALNLKSGDWRFSLKETLRLTHRDVGNHYQNVPNALELKSRFKVSYKGLKDLTPYAYAELRNVFNDPSCVATWNATTQAYTAYSFGGYNDVYFNRYRLGLGAEWSLSKQHSLDLFLLTDYCYEKEIDTNADGTALKSLTYDQAFKMNLGVAYKFSF